MGTSEDAVETTEKLVFHLIKSTQFRTVHVDGAIGGGTPRGLISVTFYSERGPIPQIIVHQMITDKENPHLARMGPVVGEETVTKQGIIRELEFATIMTVDTATSLHEWLGQQIKVAQKAMGGQK